MKRNLIVVLACLAILAAGIFIWRTLRPIPDKFDPTGALAAGQVLAEETVEAIQNKGRVVAVISEFHQAPTGAAQAEWQMFRSELKKHPGVELVATEIPVNSEGLAECSSASFKDILARYADVEAIVFLIPLPGWNRVEMQGPVAPKVLALGPAPVVSKEQLTGYFTHGVLAVLIYPRQASGADRIANPKTPRDWVHNQYQIITPQNYELLPD